jgi:hypothetical protein
MSDTMRIEILADGTIKTTTDPISAPNHASAEAFLRDVQKLTGGATSRKARHGHTHTHTHQHTHEEH